MITRVLFGSYVRINNSSTSQVIAGMGGVTGITSDAAGRLVIAMANGTKRIVYPPPATVCEEDTELPQQPQLAALDQPPPKVAHGSKRS